MTIVFPVMALGAAHRDRYVGAVVMVDGLYQQA